MSNLFKKPDDILEFMEKKSKLELDKFEKEIHAFISKYDSLYALFHIAKKYYLRHSYHPDSLDTEIDHPIVNFLFNLVVKKSPFKCSKPQREDIQNLEESLLGYCENFRANLLKEDNFLGSSQEQYLVNMTNPEIYPFQLEKKFKEIFKNINEDFLREFRFSPVSAFCFSYAITQIYKERFNNDSNKIFFTETDIATLAQPSLEELDKFDKELKSYLEFFSVERGTCNEGYNSLLDEDISWKKPLIKNPSGYLGVCLSQNQYGLLYQLENIIKTRQNNTTLWEKYSKAKSKYAEDLAYESFKRVFGENVHKNVKYKYNSNEYEIDILVIYENKVIIGEVKSSNIRTDSKAGHKTKLEKDLKTILKKAYEQTQVAREYIIADKTPLLCVDGKELALKTDLPNFEIFSICIALENMGTITQNLKSAKLDNFFKENEYPWAVNLLELEVISNHIKYPSLFLHYVKSRLESQKNDLTIVSATDELSYFGFYLVEGSAGGFDFKQEYSMARISSGYIGIFDKYYLENSIDKPEPSLDARMKSLIERWNSGHLKNCVGCSQADIVCLLLSLNSEYLKNALDCMESCIEKTKIDKKIHTASFSTDTFSFIFISEYGRVSLKEKALYYCVRKKGGFQNNKLLALGTDVTKPNGHISEALIWDLP